jgi:hypothetical protein
MKVVKSLIAFIDFCHWNLVGFITSRLEVLKVMPDIATADELDGDALSSSHLITLKVNAPNHEMRERFQETDRTQV